MKNQQVLNIISLVWVMFSIITIGSAQTKTAEFKDGKSIVYEVISRNSNEIHKLNIFVGLNLDKSTQRADLALSYIIPKFGQLRISAVPLTNVGVDGLIFLYSKEKEKNFKLYLTKRNHSKDTTSRYYVTEVFSPKRCYGVHGGYEMIKDKFRLNVIALGLGLTKLSYFKTIVHDSPNMTKIKIKQSSLIADVLVYPGKKVGDQLYYPNKNVTNVIGGRLFFEYRSSISGSKDWGGFIRIGVDYDLFGNIIPKGAMGIYAGF